MKSPVAALVLLVLLLPLSRPLRAQYTFLGPSGCVNCHDHERQTTQWRKAEPQALKRSHYKSLDSLEDKQAGAWARAAGLADAYDAKGSCVRCHATVYKGEPNAGVSCESCHGAASGYNAIHQEKGAYAKAVAGGLADLRNLPAAIARRCVSCHVVDDAALVRAGHPSGRNFVAGDSLRKLVHWNAAYDSGVVTAEARKLFKAEAAATAPAPAPAPAPVNLEKEAPPAATPSSAPPPSLPDWWKDAPLLPADYTIAEDVPAVPTAFVTRRAASSPPPADVAPAAPEPQTPSPPRDVAELRGELLKLLQGLIASGARADRLPPAAPAFEFSGPESELLRLQDEALVLALELLRRPRP